MAKFGLELLELMAVSNEHGDFDAQKGGVTVSLVATDPLPWLPTKPNDTKWNAEKKELIQVKFCFFYI